jgi:hypothetical protein
MPIAVGAVLVTALVAPANAVEGPERRIRKAAAATARESSARVTMRIAVESEGGGGEITADGVVALSGDRGRLVVDLSDIAGTPATFEERIVDGIIYLDIASALEATAREVPSELAGKHWIRIDLSQLSGLGAEQLESLDPTGGANPRSQVDALRGIDDAVRVGSEPINGTRTTHFRGTLKLSLARQRLEALPEELRDRVRAGIEQLFRGDRKLPVDLWLDDQNRLRQMKTTIEVDQPQHARVAVTLALPEFDVPVDVSAPPPDETVDFADFVDVTPS